MCADHLEFTGGDGSAYDARSHLNNTHIFGQLEDMTHQAAVAVAAEFRAARAKRAEFKARDGEGDESPN